MKCQSIHTTTVGSKARTKPQLATINMNEYFQNKKKGIITTLIISVVLIPGIINLILFLTNDPDKLMVSVVFYILGIFMALMIIFIPYFLNKKLVSFVNQKVIQDFFSKHYRIVKTETKTDKQIIKGIYKDCPFNIYFGIDNRWILSLRIELECIVDFMTNKDKYRRNQYMQGQNYQILPTRNGIEYSLTYDKENKPKENQIEQICDSLIKNAKQNNFKIGRLD